MNLYSLYDVYIAVLLLLIAALSFYFFFRHHLTKLNYNCIQTRLKAQVKFTDDLSDEIKIIAGADISFIINNSVDACISMVMLDYKTLDVVYSMTEWIKLSSDYIPGYLAFREAPHIQSLLNKLQASSDRRFYPDLLLVDGNGRLHPKVQKYNQAFSWLYFYSIFVVPYMIYYDIKNHEVALSS